MYDIWKKDLYKRLYGGKGNMFGKWEEPYAQPQAMNYALQSEAASIENKVVAKHLKEVADKYCTHGLSFDGMWCTTCAQTRQGVKLLGITVDDLTTEDIKALNAMPGKIVAINDPPYQLQPDEHNMSKYTLEFIVAGLPKLAKDQLDELYKVLHTQYDCRIYK